MSASPWTYAFAEEPLARGSQGTVWLATRSDGVKVAIKIAGSTAMQQSSLRHEIGVMRALTEAAIEGVVPVLDDIEVDGRPALVMPRYERHLGHWLEEILQRRDGEVLGEVLRTCAAVAFVLADIHRTRLDDGFVVHRDIKPENIFLDKHDDPFLGDFGGAMAIDGLRAVELALFGTPMWAPLDQILAGKTIPDPTWDTYALCVLLYACLTGERPEYQADPSELLTERGRHLWQAARSAIRAPNGERQQWHATFARARVGTRPEDLVDLTGLAALSTADRHVLTRALTSLGQRARIDTRTEAELIRATWNLLVRGLSPVSHPSPPNRFRDAEELGEALALLASMVSEPTSSPHPAPGSEELARLVAPLGALPAHTTVDMRAPPRTTLRRGIPMLGGLIFSGLMLGLVSTGWLYRERLAELSSLMTPLPAVVSVDTHDPVFSLDTTEVSVASWQACVQLGSCIGSPSGPPDLPAVGLDHDEARTLCAHRGGRLPTHAEWMAAAGPGPYPWGSESPTCSLAIAMGCGDTAAPVGSARRGASPVGAVNLAGNAWEWVEGLDGPLLVGGGARSPAAELRVGASHPAPTEGRHPLAGVRCAYAPEAP